MRVRFLFICVLFLCSRYCLRAQNLVPNPSFENHGNIICSWVLTNTEFTGMMSDWTMPTAGSTDVFCTCSPVTCYSNANSTYIAPVGRQNPRTGEVMSAILTYGAGCSSERNYREYLQVRLNAPLVPGKRYYGELYVSACDLSEGMTNNIAMAFTPTAVTSADCGPLFLNPQIIEKNIITDKDNWVKVSGEFIASAPAASYLTIGNFTINDSTAFQRNPDSNRINVRYFVDDVLVKEIISNIVHIPDTVICAGDNIRLYAANFGIKGWGLKNNPGVFFTTDSVTTVSPAVTTQYTVYGKDTAINVTVTVIPEIRSNNNVSVCENDSIKVGIHVYKLPGTYLDTLIAASGCDSIVTTRLVVLPKKSGVQSVTVCEGTVYKIGIHTYNVSGIYNDTLQAVSGCDSIVTTRLTVLQKTYISQPVTICSGGSYTIGIHTYTAEGTYKDTLQTVMGCDSIVMTLISVGLNQELYRQYSICEGEQITVRTHTYNRTGIYKDTVKGLSGCGTIITSDLTVKPLPVANLGEDQIICANTSATLDAGNAGADFFWNTNEFTQTITVAGTGSFYVAVTKNNCSKSDTVNITVLPELEVSLGNDTTVCNRDKILLDVTTPDGVYLWQDGSTLPGLVVTKEGKYKVVVYNRCASDSDEVLILFTECDCEYYIPNAFTPNNDGINDVYGVLNNCTEVVNFKFEVFNRWGELVFSAGNPDVKWDGYFKGEPQPADSYVFILSYTQLGQDYYKKGTCVLIR